MPAQLCPTCKSRMVAAAEPSGKPQCLKCDSVDPIKTVALKWADSGLSAPK
jgi:hypothetical protein